MIPERYESQLYSVMRIVIGAVFLTYGLMKFGIGGDAVPFLSWPFGVAGVIETIVGVLVILGLFTKYAAFVASGEMAYAYFSFHVPMSFHPVVSDGDIAIVLCFAFLYMAARGSGIFSVDAMRAKG